MNWENSKALTKLKKDFLKEFFSIEKRFFLTGGSALGIFYLDHRLSYDLDFFTCEKNINWKEIEGTIGLISNKIDASFEHIKSAPTFHRFQLVRNNEIELIDFVIEYVEQIDSVKNNISGMIIDTKNEISVNKICTLLSRSETKDIIDLYFLHNEGFDIVKNIENAQKKDAGLEPAILSFLLSSITIKDIPNYMLKEISVNEINSFISDLQIKLADIAFPK